MNSRAKEYGNKLRPVSAPTGRDTTHGNGDRKKYNEREDRHRTPVVPEVWAENREYTQLEHVGMDGNDLALFKSNMKSSKKEMTQAIDGLSTLLNDHFLQIETRFKGMERQSLKAQNGTDSYSKSDLQKRIDELESENQFLKSTAVNEAEYARVVQKLDEKRSRIKEQFDEIKQLREELRSAQQDNKDLTSRLSAEMSTKIAADETSIENVSIKNRPLNIAEEYDKICTGAWLEAKTAIDQVEPSYGQTYPETDKLNYLCDIFQIAEQEALKLQRNFNSQIYTMLLDPLSDQPMTKRRYPEASVKIEDMERAIPQHLKNYIGDFMRSSAQNIDLKSLAKQINEQLSSKYQYTDFGYKIKFNRHAKNSVAELVDVTAKLAWNMVNQRPHMRFETSDEDSAFDPQYHEVSWGSSSPQDKYSKIAAYAYPVLIHGDTVMVRGKVYLTSYHTGQSSGQHTGQYSGQHTGQRRGHPTILYTDHSNGQYSGRSARNYTNPSTGYRIDYPTDSYNGNSVHQYSSDHTRYKTDYCHQIKGGPGDDDSHA